MSQPIFNEDDYLELIQGLLPLGSAFPRAADSTQTAVLRGFAKAQAENQLVQYNLLIDAFPATTVSLIDEWEKSLSLPDPCLGPNPLLRERQASILAKFIATGGQSIPFLLSICVLLGFPNVTFTEFQPYRVGQPVGEPLLGEGWAYALLINNLQFSVHFFEVGRDTAGEPLAVWSNNQLVCELRRMAPAHVALQFAFM